MQKKNNIRNHRVIKGCMTLMICFMMLCIMKPITAQAYSGAYYGSISSGQGKYFNFSSSWGFDVYSFTPSTTGNYTFYSYSRGSGDPYFYLTSPSYYSTVYNSLTSYGCRNDTASAYSLTCNDDGNGDYNFSVSYTCYAGQTYYCFVTKYSTSATYAYFSINGPGYNRVSLDRNGGSGGSTYYYNGGNGYAWASTGSSGGMSYITPPTRTGYTFSGYYNATSGGTLYIASNGYLYDNARRCSGTLYAQWVQQAYTLTYNNQGVSNTTQVVGYSNYLPSSVNVPARTGYTFQGYYTGTGGSGTQYYNSSGSRVQAVTMPNSNFTVYAYWTPTQYTINYEGTAGAAPTGGGTNPATHTYGTVSTIKDMEKTGYTFMGWSIPGNPNRIKNLTLGATQYTGAITLKANWAKQTDIDITENDDLTADTETNQADLRGAFNSPVSDTLRGVTSDEMSNNAGVKLELSVSAAVNDGSLDAIRNVAAGKVVSYFDATVQKTITPFEGTPTTTILKELPNTIAVDIPLSTEQRGKPSYAVYRYHTEVDKTTGNTYSEVQEISNDINQTEHYVIGTDKITVYTRMFSTFAIIAGEDSLTAMPVNAGDKNSSGVDVQGKVSQSGLEPVYKLDISWGSMSFVFTTASEWDPYNHTWGDPAYSWSSESFNGTNNKLTVTNHSNADVNSAISFSKEISELENTEVSFHQANTLDSDAVNSMYIPKVNIEGGAPNQAETFVLLSGTPVNLPGEIGEAFKKVGVITLTFSGNADTGLTSRNS